jgi:hypothetical protein
MEDKFLRTIIAERATDLSSQQLNNRVTFVKAIIEAYWYYKRTHVAGQTEALHHMEDNGEMGGQEDANDQGQPPTWTTGEEKDMLNSGELRYSKRTYVAGRTSNKTYVAGRIEDYCYMEDNDATGGQEVIEDKGQTPTQRAGAWKEGHRRTREEEDELEKNHAAQTEKRARLGGG